MIDQAKTSLVFTGKSSKNILFLTDLLKACGMETENAINYLTDKCQQLFIQFVLYFSN